MAGSHIGTRTTIANISFCALIFLTMMPAGVASAATRAIVVGNAWSRPAVGTAVVYAFLRNPNARADRLVGADSPAASRVTLHETSDVKMLPMSTTMGDLPMTGAMTSMKPLSFIPIPAHGITLLKPGGYHLMLELHRAIRAGQIVPFRLHFRHAGWIAANATVRATP